MTDIIHSVYVLVDDDAEFQDGVECKFVTAKDLPTKGNYYVLSKNGTQVRKMSTVVDALVPTNDLYFLAESPDDKYNYKLPILPAALVNKAHTFFQMVWDKFHAEAEVMILYNRRTKEYVLWCPNQSVSGGSVDYKMDEELGELQGNGFIVIGTIHSHCNFSAYHSGVDIHDEHDQDGLHITLGHVDRADFSAAASIVIDGNRKQVPPEEVMNVVNTGGSAEEIYEEEVEDEADDEDEGMGFFQGIRSGWRSLTTSWRDRSRYFRVNDAPSADEQADLEDKIEDEWMPRVSRAFVAAKNSRSKKWDDDDDDRQWGPLK